MNRRITALRQHDQVGATAAALPTADRSRSEEYRTHAAECQGIANGWPDLIKQQYEELAGQWRVLAEQVERQ
jgi:hypothetical protein